MSGPVRVGYLVSRFPAASETFVVRELNEVVREADAEVTLMSLFPSSDEFLHPEAERWLPGLLRPTLGEGLRALGGWLLRRPLATAGLIGRIVADCVRSPRVLLRSLATVPIAAAHALNAERLGLDRLHAHFAAYPTLAAWICHRLCGLPYSFTAHAYDIFVDQSMLATKVAEAEFVATISEYNVRFLADHGGGSKTPVHVVHCGVDPDRYEFRPRSAPVTGEVDVLCVASLQEKKGHAYLLEALAGGGPELERVALDLVGGGELREALERRASELGLAERVRFHGARSEVEVRAMLGNADAFVLPSIIGSDGQMEGLPVALIEALACGLPTVATRMSGVPELIEEGRTGWLAEPADPGELAAALRRVVEAEPLQLDRGRELVEREFDVRRSGARMAELFGAPPRRRS